MRDGDTIEIEIDRNTLAGHVELVETFDASSFGDRSPHPDLQVDPDVPDDTRLWAALQQAGGGTWGGCVYDVDEIIKRLDQSK